MQQPATVVPAAIVRFASIEPVPDGEIAARAATAFKGSASGSVRAAAVAYALFLAGHYEAAAAAWKELYEKTNPSDSVAMYLYAGSLREAGHASEAAPLLKYNPLPAVTLAPRFETLYFPKIYEWRGDHAMFLKLSGNTAAPAK
jgi:hypothetical protein